MSNVEAIKKAFPNMFRQLKWNHFSGATEYGAGEWFAHGTNKTYQIFDVRAKYPDDLPFYAKELSCQFETLEEAQEAVRTRDEQDIFQRLEPDFLTTLEALQRENERLQAEIDRTERNRDMWKGQVERQAKQIEDFRSETKRLQVGVHVETLPRAHLIRVFADDMNERNWDDKRLYIKQQAERITAALASAGEEHHAE